MKLFALGVIALMDAALPAARSFWETESLVETRIRSHYRKCRRRSRIINYADISPVLSSFCENTVLAPKFLRQTDLALAVRRLAEAVVSIECG